MLRRFVVQHPKLVRCWLSSLQEPDSVRRQDIERMHEGYMRDQMPAELDADRAIYAPVAMAYVISALTIFAPVAVGGFAIWWLL